MAAVNCEEFGGLLILRIAGSLTLEHAEEWARALSVAWSSQSLKVLRLTNLHDCLGGLATEWSTEGAAADCVFGSTQKREVVQ
jgi:hypothetical protein